MGASSCLSSLTWLLSFIAVCLIFVLALFVCLMCNQSWYFGSFWFTSHILFNFGNHSRCTCFYLDQCRDGKFSVLFLFLWETILETVPLALNGKQRDVWPLKIFFFIKDGQCNTAACQLQFKKLSRNPVPISHCLAALKEIQASHHLNKVEFKSFYCRADTVRTTVSH